MDLQDPRLRSQLRQANKVANAGKRAAAEQLYRQIIEEAPDVAEAWFGLGQMVNGASEREEAYQKALAIKPDYADAARALAQLRGEPVPEWAVELEPEVEEVVEEVIETAVPQPETETEDHAHTAVATPI